jgi:pyrroline-5-carboxylate reductase
VTSPQGATAAGLATLERAGVDATIERAVRAVYERALELGVEVAAATDSDRP